MTHRLKKKQKKKLTQKGGVHPPHPPWIRAWWGSVYWSLMSIPDFAPIFKVMSRSSQGQSPGPWRFICCEPWHTILINFHHIKVHLPALCTYFPNRTHFIFHVQVMALQKCSQIQNFRTWLMDYWNDLEMTLEVISRSIHGDSSLLIKPITINQV